MQSLKNLCIPRQSVFDTQRRDTVLDISDLVANKITPDSFFAENFVTEGMRTLLTQCFKRLEGKSAQGIFRLKQAMGGGKTHNLLALGLLAKHPDFRKTIMGSFYESDQNSDSIKVVAFSGRESDAPLGIWGAIAAQLNKKDFFKDNYAPLKAPGQTAWENLFKDETVLILLDELAPYFENAQSIAIGDSNLSRVTATALENLLVAINKPSCARVCLVISELKGAHESGSNLITDLFKDLEGEIGRVALPIEPVRMNADEFYHILRKRLFENLPTSAEIIDVAQGYAKAIRDARKMDITDENPEQYATRIESSYPFHPAIRDLYGRFKENPGFQQTRALIRLMRIVVSHMWTSAEAEKRYLISAHDLDFNDQETRTEVAQINATLDNAIAHDIASDGNAVAEKMDLELNGTDTRDTCRLLLMASLANVPNSILGLSIPELIADLAEPGRDLARLKDDILAKLATSAWFLHSDRDGKLFFKNVQNLNAKLEDLVRAYHVEQAVKELRSQLDEIFKINQGWCYQKVLSLPAADEIELDQDKVTLIITEPYPGGGLRPELLAFFKDATWKNRLAFLTGSKKTYDQLLDTGKRLKAIQQILADLKAENVPAGDPQMVQANDLSDRIRSNFRSAVRETFTQLWYPIDENGEAKLKSTDFNMQFEENRYNGEQQILNLLKEQAKFEEAVTGEVFRKKCEQRIFDNQSMPWIEIKRRAAMLPKWQWHIPQALENLKTDCLQKDIWRENGGYIDKGPFPQPRTSASIQELLRDDNNGEATLKITPIHGDTIYYEFGAAATTASAKLDGSNLKTIELRVSFLVVDSTREHETGESVTWQNRITIKHRIYLSGKNKKMELKAAPDATIHYSTDGSDPKNNGATYDGDFIIPAGSQFVLVYAERDGVTSAVERINIPRNGNTEVAIDPKKPVAWKRDFAFNITKESYEFLARAKAHQAVLSGCRLTISGEGGNKEWVELSMFEEKLLTPVQLEETLEALRRIQSNGQVQISISRIHFEKGQDLLDWVEEMKTTLTPGEVKQ